MPEILSEFVIFQKGGLIMYGLALLSVYAVAVVIFKVIQFRKANVFDRSFIEPARASFSSRILRSVSARLAA